VSAPPSGEATTPSRRAAAPYESALRQLLPSREQGLLLAACLGAGDAAARAWSGLVTEVRDVKTYFEANQTGLKGMLPFIEASLGGNGIDAGKTFHTYARVALVREELRSRIYGEILDSVLLALEAAQIPTVLLKGGALAATVYPQPATRHNHAIDLLVDAAQMTAATAVLSKVQFKSGPVTSGAACHRDFRHASGLALGLHSQLLFLPHFEMPLDQIRARTRSIRLGGKSIRVMSPEDNLVHVIGHATYSRSRTNLRWACDAYYLLRGNPALNWSVVIETAAQSRLELPAWMLLRWVTDVLAAPIPAEPLAELHRRSRTLDAVTAEGIFAALLHSTLSRRQAFRAFDTSWRAQLGFLKFSAFPSPRYVRWRHAVDHGWKLPAYYADRPRRLALRLAAGAARRIGYNGGVDPTAVPAKKRAT
jgi:hypothetical protein